MPNHFLSVKNSHAQQIASCFEVVAEAEIPQHLKESMVKRGAADVVDITGAQTFLAGRGAGEFQFHFAQKMVLELVHSGRSEQDRGIPGGHQDIARFSNAAFGFKKFEIFFAKLVSFHGRYDFVLERNWGPETGPRCRDDIETMARGRGLFQMPASQRP